MALNERTSSDRMDVVLNDYLDGSMKRTGGKVQEASFITIKQIKQWRKFLYSTVNGTSRIMIVFVTKEWPKEKYAVKDG